MQLSTSEVNNMKVLLINPPQTFHPGSEPPAGNLPIGLMYIAAVLAKAGVNVEILDAFMGSGSTFKKDGEVTTVGMPPENIKKEIEKHNPDIVGLAGPFTCQISNTLQVSKLVKQVNLKILTVVGGPHVTLVPIEFLEEAKDVDIVVVGEGEFTMVEITQVFQGGRKIRDIKGVAYRQEGKVVLNYPRPPIDDLDGLPYPAYNLVDMEHYLN